MTSVDPRLVAEGRAPSHPAVARAIALDASSLAVSGRASRHFAGFRATFARAVGKWLRRYGAVLLFLLVWQLASQFDLVDPSVIPSFTDVVAAMIDGFIGGKLLDNMLVSLGRSGLAFGIAVGLAVPLGLFMGSFRRFEELVDSLLQLFRQTAALAIYPVFILLLGLGETSKITIICWAAFFPVLLNTVSGVKQVDRRLIEMARVFGASYSPRRRRRSLSA